MGLVVTLPNHIPACRSEFFNELVPYEVWVVFGVSHFRDKCAGLMLKISCETLGFCGSLVPRFPVIIPPPNRDKKINRSLIYFGLSFFLFHFTLLFISPAKVSLFQNKVSMLLNRVTIECIICHTSKSIAILDL